MNGAPDRRLERLGQLFELAFGFLMLPLIVATMDHPPLWAGGRTLLWVGLGLLFVLQPPDVRSRLFQRMKPARGLPGGWIGPVVLYVLSLGGLVVVLQMLDVWAPPPSVGQGGIPAALLFALLGTLFAVLPMEILFRVYLPMRFRGLTSRRPSLCIQGLSTFLFAWFFVPTLSPSILVLALVLGGMLALMERAGWPFWGTLFAHGMAVWAWTVAPRLFTEVLPWAG